MSGKPRLYVGPLPTGGFAVLTYGGRLKIGPNPLPTRRAAKYVKRVFEILNLDWTSPQPPTAANHNSAAIGRCPKLQAWANWRAL